MSICLTSNSLYFGLCKKINSDIFKKFESKYLDPEFYLLDLAQNNSDMEWKLGTIIDLHIIYIQKIFMIFGT